MDITDSLGSAAQQPQQGGFLNGLGNILAHPAVQGLLATYLGVISSPRRMGLGAALGQGGLMGLNAYNQGLGAQERAASLGLERQRLQQEVDKQQHFEQAIKGLPANEQAIGYISPGSLGTMEIEKQKQATVHMANQQVAQELRSAYPNDPIMAHLTSAIENSPEYQKPDEILKSYQEIQMNPLKLKETLESINQKEILARKEQGDINLQPLTAARDRAAIAAANASAQASLANTGLTPLRADKLRADIQKDLQGPVPPEHLETDINDPNITRYTRKTTPDTGMKFGSTSKGKASDPLAKLNQDLNSFTSTNKSNEIFSNESKVQAGIDYLSKLNPKVDRSTIEGLVRDRYRQPKAGGAKTTTAAPTPQGVDNKKLDDMWNDLHS